MTELLSEKNTFTNLKLIQLEKFGAQLDRIMEFIIVIVNN